MTTTFVQHTTNPIQVEVSVAFFTPSDARRGQPFGSATVNLTVDADDLADDHWVTIDNAAEAWCEATHGKGSFWGVIPEE
jgi:hypothetical protein